MLLRSAILLTMCALTAISGLARNTAAAEVPPKVGDTPTEFELPTFRGDNVKLSSLAAKGPVVLVVLRGFPGSVVPTS